MAVEDAAPFVNEVGDRVDHDRPDRDLGDEMTVADVEVEDPRVGSEEGIELLAQTREVSGVDRGLHLDATDPRVPTHGRILLTRP